jgi:hypothetical protein
MYVCMYVNEDDDEAEGNSFFGFFPISFLPRHENQA